MPPRPRRPRVPVILTALVVAGVALFYLFRGPGPVAKSPIERATFEEFQIGGVPRSIVTTEDGIWVARADRSVVKVDPDDGSRLAKGQLPFLPGQMIAIGRTVWVGAIEGSAIARLDPLTARVREEIEVGTTPQSLAMDDDNVYAAAFDDGVIKTLDPSSGQVKGDLYSDPDAFPSSMAVASGGLWVTDVVADVVTRLPAPDGAKREVPVGDSPTRVVAGEGSIWVANFNDRSITRIDPDSNTSPDEILVGGKPGALVTSAGYVWVLRPGSDSFVVIDVGAGRWTGDVYDVEEAPQDLSVGHGYLWIISQGGTLTRVPVP